VEHYAGLDVSLKLTSVRIVDAHGDISRETKIASNPAQEKLMDGWRR